ncbi:hypothetical protein OZ411_22585 [Bradyrhizobium sp. Arg237L]|uniref:hypothetical protein n=1 Tax=Bradyrhizobium sp. Arg237L TaxID=3003352 RepID=UPI00249E8190|nr:hypothetical protein [Bradyrhizobium sp. Arg237L]MDI4235598.1 hypothetical protein [Bradyrhizobium sp. Arg237L]
MADDTFVTIQVHLFHAPNCDVDRAARRPDVLDQANKDENARGADFALMARVCWHHFKEDKPRM